MMVGNMFYSSFLVNMYSLVQMLRILETLKLVGRRLRRKEPHVDLRPAGKKSV